MGALKGQTVPDGLWLLQYEVNHKTDKWMGALKRQTVPDGLWLLQYEVNHKRFTLQTHFNPKLTKHASTFYIAQ